MKKQNKTSTNAALERLPFVFDGFGINGPDVYRSRLATLTDAGHAAGIGPRIEAALNAMAISENEEARRGELIAGILKLRKKEGRFVTTWGDKTAVGLFRTVERLISEGE